ncbi:galactose oxidase [Boletus edulis]|nr:galactose oxidase [Boletus edulis]
MRFGFFRCPIDTLLVTHVANSVLARSSHSAAVSNTGRLLLFSGERRPRLPVDNDLHVLDLESTSPSLRTFAALAGSPAPEPRVGAAAVYDPHTNNLYVGRGHGGVYMVPIDRFQAGIWNLARYTRHPKANYIFMWDAQRRADSPLLPTTSPLTPGISPQMHPPDLADDSIGDAIAAVITRDSELVPIRFGGFQLPQVTQGTSTPLDIYYMPSTNTWLTVNPAPDPGHGFPGARSVHGLVPLSHRDASSVGHAGAGVFWNDTWLLVVTSTSTSTPSLERKKPPVEGTALPEPRGWFPSASYIRDGKTRVVLTGGLLSSNERSGEVCVGDVEL